MDATVRTTTNTYNRRGDLLITTHPDGSKQEFVYGTAGRISSAAWRTPTNLFRSLLSSVAYAPTGSPETVTLANGVVTTYNYDETELYRLAGKKSVKSGVEFQDFTYTYDAVGNITKIVDAPTIYAQVTHVLSYDDLHRLTSAVSTSTTAALAGTKNFAYNQIGNLTSMTGVGTYTYNHTGANVYANPHAPTTFSTHNLTYDKNGNLLTDGTWTNTWDYKNRMITSVKTTNTVSYLYDHTGRRVKKTDTTAAVPTYYVDGSYEVEGNRIQRHVHVPGIGFLATVSTTNTTHTYAYHLTDHLGSPHVETNFSGVSVRYQVYEPYGKVRYASGSYTTDYKFTGKEQDTETSLQYFGARYYDNTRGQFTSSDPVFLQLGSTTESSEQQKLLKDPQLWNSYGYARSNPLIQQDTSGAFLDTFIDIAFIAYDLGDIAVKASKGNWKGVGVGALALSADVGGAFVPFASGGGMAVRAGMKAGKVVDVAKTAEKTTDALKAGKRTTDFVVTPGGTAFPVPTKATGPVPSVNKSGKTTGTKFFGGSGGVNKQVENMRIMNPTDRYPNGYIKYENIRGQGLNPYTGKPVSHPESHFPINR